MDTLRPEQSQHFEAAPSAAPSEQKEQRESPSETPARPTVSPTSEPAVSTASQAPQSTASTIEKTEAQAIESILEEGLGEFFMALNPTEKLRFKERGEQAAQKIVTLIHRGSFKVSEIIRIIVDWLKALPGINRFFLEQEAKIKADAIAKRYRHE